MWSIAQERLGSRATAQRIANAAERIYALNRDQIGADPTLIYADQSLLLPQNVARPTPSRNATEAPRNDATARATETTPDQAPRPTTSQADPKAGKAFDAWGERAHLPDMARPVPVPETTPLAQDPSTRSPVESLVSKARSAASGTYVHRRLLGAALLVLNLVLLLSFALLVVQRWREAYRRATPTPDFGSSHVDHENGAAEGGRSLLSRGGSATGAYSPKIDRALSGAQPAMRPRRSPYGSAKGTRRGDET